MNDMEMKMFIHSQPDEAQNSVNQWLSSHQVEIMHVNQSQCERQGRFVFIICIYYREAGKLPPYQQQSRHQLDAALEKFH